MKKNQRWSSEELKQRPSNWLPLNFPAGSKVIILWYLWREKKKDSEETEYIAFYLDITILLWKKSNIYTKNRKAYPTENPYRKAGIQSRCCWGQYNHEATVTSLLSKKLPSLAFSTGELNCSLLWHLFAKWLLQFVSLWQKSSWS